MKIASVAGSSATTERRHGLLHRRQRQAAAGPPSPSPQLKPLARQRGSPQPRGTGRAQKRGGGGGGGSPDWQDNNAQLAAGRSAGAARAARLHPGSGASPNRLGRAGAEPLAPLVSPVKELHQFAGPGSSPPSQAHFERGTWYQKHGAVEGERPVLPYREAVAESWELHQQTATLYEEAIRHKRKTLGETHASTLLSIRKLAELCEIRGDMVHAELLFAEAFAGYARKHGDEHSDTVLAERNLARVRSKLPKVTDTPALTGKDLRQELMAMLSVTLTMAVNDAVSDPAQVAQATTEVQGSKTTTAFASTAAASSVREVFREVPVGLRLDMEAQQAESRRVAEEARRAVQAANENTELRHKVERLESELAAAAEEKRTTARRHQWEIADLQRRLAEFASRERTLATRHTAPQAEAAAAPIAEPPRKLMMVRQMEAKDKALGAAEAEIANLKAKLAHHEEAASRGK